MTPMLILASFRRLSGSCIETFRSIFEIVTQYQICMQEWVDWLSEWRAALLAAGVTDDARRAAQNKVNPVYVPRQHLLQIAIEAAEKGEYGELETLLEVLRQPYTEQDGMSRFAQAPSPEMVRPGVSMLSCSS